MKHWHAAKTGNHQGLIVSEGDGRNVAVSYAKEDAPLLAAAPDLLEALKDCLASLERLPDQDGAYRVTCIQQARAAIAKVEGNSC